MWTLWQEHTFLLSYFKGFMVRQTQVVSYFPLAISSKHSSLFLSPFNTDKCKQHCAWPRLTHNWLHLLPLFSQQMKSSWCCSMPAIPVLEEATETIWRLVLTQFWHVKEHLILTIFCTFRHNFSWWQKRWIVCYIATRFESFPYLKI